MLLHRKSLVEIGGLQAEKLQPEWCLQNEGVCPMKMDSISFVSVEL
jgi:hypothetical protein